jgi:two-component system, NarL family, nitrate/nitrite response regulator NarL
MKPITLALIDDHPIVIEGLTHVLEERHDFRIVATGATLREAREIAQRYLPDVMILHSSLSGDTIATISDLGATHPGIRILVFASDLGVDHAVRALEAGARGYVSKSCPLSELLRAAGAIAAGETYVSTSFASIVIPALRKASANAVATQDLKLSVRENQIVRLLLDGKTNREIAGGLGITEGTVKHYMTILKQKLNARNRVEVVIAAQNLDGHGTAPSTLTRSVVGRRVQQYATSGTSLHSSY